MKTAHALELVRAHSRFLTEEVERHPELLRALCAGAVLHRAVSYEDARERLERSLLPGPPAARELARFRRREMLGILLRDLRGLADLAEITGALSTVADAILDVVYARLRTSLEARHGAPVFNGKACGFSIVALGKLGGEELNYSSDIDLMFVYDGPGETSGRDSISNHEFFKSLSTQLAELLSSYTPEGLAYRVDLRLRPDGRTGEICLSVDAATRYYETRARDWELQMLIKARAAAGDRGPARRLLDAVEPRIYDTSLDFNAIESVSQTRERIHERLASKRTGGNEINVKLCQGGIRDIEFLVQCLQRLHGGRERWLRHGGTLLSLFRLRDKGLLSPTEYARLASAYQFFRTLEHRLQIADDLQTHSLSLDPDALNQFARRMPPPAGGTEMTGNTLLEQLHVHREEVVEIYERVVHANQPDAPAQPQSNLVRSLDQRAPGLAASMAQRTPSRGAARFEHFLERVRQMPELMQLLDGDATLAARVIDLFDASPYLSEQLLRAPELLNEFTLFGAGPGNPPHGATPADLRRWYRREMFRTLCESVCLSKPVFDTLEETSRLGELAIAAAYDIAVREQPRRTQMMVIALGRLGMREFDLGSDADLIFVVPNREAAELEYWTKVAEKIIDVLTSYTGEGVIFSVDTRLRPNGREGALVQTEQAYKSYFESRAEAWEGMAFMKSHAVAGDINRATDFLNELQELDWRRYGQGERSIDDLRRMRMRLEKEMGEANPLKAGPGGYYDTDFTLMYLRLRSAGIFFKHLSTPRRIDIVEKMGHLDRDDAAFLREAAAFYRAIDHGLRLIHGHAEGALPTSPMELEILGDLVHRWTGRNDPLPERLEGIRTQTRAVFDRLFRCE